MVKISKNIITGSAKVWGYSGSTRNAITIRQDITLELSETAMEIPELSTTQPQRKWSLIVLLKI